jgi:hypothetical protein
MNLRHLLPVIAALALTACARLTYAESPALQNFFLEHVPGLHATAITRVDLCDARPNSSGPAEAFASVLFQDNRLYLYKLDQAEGHFSLKYVTADISEVKSLDMNGGMGCLQSTPGRFIIKRAQYPVGGERPLQFEVRNDVSDNQMFDDVAKGELKLLAQVVTDAVTAQTKFISPRKSWGID